MYLWYLEKIWRKSAIPDTKKCVGNKFVSARRGPVGQMCRLLAVGPTCRRHVGDFPSQGSQQAWSVAVQHGVVRERGVVAVRNGISVVGNQRCIVAKLGINERDPSGARVSLGSMESTAVAVAFAATAVTHL